MKAPKVSQNVKLIPMQKITPPIVQQQENNKAKPITIIHAIKQKNQQSPLLTNSQPGTTLLKNQQPIVLTKCQPPKRQSPGWMASTIKSKDEQSGAVECKRPKLNLASGITITPIKGSVGQSTIIANNHGNSVVSNVGSVTIKPRTDKVTIVPKPTIPTVIEIQPVKPMNAAISKPAKRVAPTKISDTVTMRASSIEKSSDSDMLSRDSSSAANDDIAPNTVANGTNKPEQEHEPKSKRPKIIENAKAPMHDDYVQLIEVCKNADPTEDMKKIVAKLEKYYYKAHTAFVNSKCFHRLVQTITNEIREKPKQVYMKINSLFEELKTRKATEIPTVSTGENTKMSEADEKKAKQIQKLSDALRSLQKRIRKCEESEVDWEDELNSKYLVTERYKKRAWEIYEKLCDLTGESRSAERIVKKPIKFTGTEYPEFNRKLEKFINDTKSFPDMFDVLRIMDHCSKQYNYRMSKEHRKIVGKMRMSHFQKKIF